MMLFPFLCYLLALVMAPVFGFFAPVATLSPFTSSSLDALLQPNGVILSVLQKNDREEIASSSSPSSKSSYSSSRWENFDYLQHWYPVCWKVDMPVGRPTKFAVFDQDYAVVLKDNGAVMAFVDQCPHRSAALSEGRLTSNGYLQCAYHGWSFDAQGTCRQIPQSASSSSTAYSARSCATAVPALLHQGMVWLWPGPQKPNKMPPTIPELDQPNEFKVSRTVRDFPMIDWSLLLSNIMDPDHGIFAHQLAGFDMYSASKEYPMRVTEEFDNLHGWTLSSRVLAAEKLRARHFAKPGTQPTATEALPTATTIFYAPTVVTIGRRDAQNQTKFLSCFFVTPTGTGKSRFHSATAGRAPFTMPRWFQHCFLNRFLDQDSVLVASQQPHTLRAELERLDASSASKKGPRQDLYAYQSPSDRAVRLVDAFWDATLSRVPNRAQRLREMSFKGELRGIPSREVILDRASQHLSICKDSQDAVRNCQRITAVSALATAAWCLARVSSSSSSWLLPRPLRSIAWPIAASLSGWIANTIRQHFYYSYTNDKREKDLQKIPTTTWRDPE